MEWRNGWPKTQPKQIARFVNSEWAAEVLSETWKKNNLDLIKKGQIRELVEEIYQVLVSRFESLHYTLGQYNHRENAQYPRTPEQILRSPSEGNCLDLSLLFCGLCLERGLLPLLIFVEGHVFVAISLNYNRLSKDKFSPDDPIRRTNLKFPGGLIKDKEAISKVLEDESYLAVECTGFARTESLDKTSPEGKGRGPKGLMSFPRAVEAGKEQLTARDFQYALEIDWLLHEDKGKLTPHDRIGELSLREQLKVGSQRYFDEISLQEDYKKIVEKDLDLALESIQLYSSVSSEDAHTALMDSLHNTWNKDSKSLVLHSKAEGGKTTCCFCVWNTNLRQDKRPIAIYIPCKEIEIDEEIRDHERPILGFIVKKYLKHYSIKNSELDKLHAEFEEGNGRELPQYQIILDGYQDIDNKTKIKQHLNNFWVSSKAAATQVLITTSTDLPATASPLGFNGMEVFKLKKSVYSTTTTEVKTADKEEVIPTIYVVTAKAGEIKSYFEKKKKKSFLKKIPSNRYHEERFEDWRPYSGKLEGSTIKEIIEELKSKEKLKGIEKYLNGEKFRALENDKLDEIDKHPKNYIGIFDLLALQKEDTPITALFDRLGEGENSGKIGGLILPIDEEFPKEVLQKVKERRTYYFSRSMRSSKMMQIAHFYDTRDKSMFKGSLLHFLKKFSKGGKIEGRDRLPDFNKT